MTHPYFVRVTSKYAVSEGKVVGVLPCYNGMIDPVVMIALRCQDTKINIDSIQEIPVDLENKDQNSSEDWLLHVQTARMEEEQNLLLTSKNGKLYCITKKKIKPKSELLIWYSEDLLHVLGVKNESLRMKQGEGFTCHYCDEKFRFSNPHLAHVLFKCQKRHLATLQDVPHLQSITNNFMSENLPNDNRLNQVKHQDYRSKNDEATKERIPQTSMLKRKNTDDVEDQCCKSKINSDYRSLEHKTSEIVSKVNGNKVSENQKQDFERTYSAFRRVESGSRQSSQKQKSEKISGVQQSSASPKTHGRENEDSKVNGSQRKLTTSALTDIKPPFRRAGVPSPATLLFGVNPTLGMLPPEMSSRNAHFPEMLPTKLLDTKPSDMVSHMNLIDQNKMLISNYLNESPMLPMASYPTVVTPTSLPPPISPMMPMPQMSALLPATMATVNYSHENWCAKCNASFRMTSDLVYHMRTHHKREFDGNRKKRDEKLKCQICNESFRERHHLTRHMTSHM